MATSLMVVSFDESNSQYGCDWQTVTPSFQVLVISADRHRVTYWHTVRPCMSWLTGRARISVSNRRQGDSMGGGSNRDTEQIYSDLNVDVPFYCLSYNCNSVIG